MPSSTVEELILIVATVIIGLVIFGYVASSLIPAENFSLGQQQASSLSSSTTLSVGPLLISKGGTGSTVVEVYNPSQNGNVELLVFVEPSYLESSVGVLTPSSTPSFTVYLPNGEEANTLQITTPIYDINGKVLYKPNSLITVYTIPFNTPVTVNVQNVNNNDIIVIWVMYNTAGYWFRISFSFTGVPLT